MKAELQGTSSSLGRSLENRILAQASATHSLTHAQIGPHCVPPSWVHQLSSPSLQPSHLSSTNSSLQLSSSLFSSTDPSLLSSTSSSLQPPSSSLFSSPLLSTQNHLLQSAPLLPSLASPAGLLLPPSAQPPAAAGEEVQEGGKGTEGEIVDSEDLETPMDDWSHVSEDGSWAGSQSDESAEIDAPDMCACEEEEQVPVLEGEEFGEVEERNSEQEEELKDKKYLLLNVVCCSLVHKYINPGQEDWDTEDSVWMGIKSLAEHISQSDPEFLLKVAVYTRQELNIRITANFLLALAAHLPATKPHLRRYFGAAVQLPSDWLEVVRIYSTCFGRSLPSCLKKALVEKFKHFGEYQLAKYNTRKHRCKHNRKRAKPKARKPSSEQLKKWSRYLDAVPRVLETYITRNLQRPVVDKKASVFSLKKMIQRLHIRDPAEHVMPILGKRYPRDVQAFSRSGLSGAWQRERAGQRMRLQQPDSWERSLSQEGNKARTWEGLIDRKSLPFMAMLRNLRNMISVGISETHHRRILARLTNKEAVIRSRQFPFRFLSAHKSILELKKLVKEMPSSKEILRSILLRVPRGPHKHSVEWDTAGHKRMRVALGVPFVSGRFRMEKARLQRISPKRCTPEVLDRYQQALEQAVQISCKYNVPPLPGRTLLLCNMDMDFYTSWSSKLDFCYPPDPEDPQDQSDDDPEPKLQEVALLLAMMIGHCSEHFELLLVKNCGFEEAELKSDLLLDNVWHVMKQVKSLRENLGRLKDYNELLLHLVTKKAKVDTIISLMDYTMHSDLEHVLNKYRKDINPETLQINMLLISSGTSVKMDHRNIDRNVVELHGFSEQVLRFIGERGSSRLLDHVERIDKLHSIPPPEGAKDQNGRDTAVCSLPATPKLRWRAVRVFVSSTFRDMHGERDVLVRRVFPELRRRAAPHCLYLQEVELRWGITEEEAGRALELCLSHVCRSQLLLGILGERYGLVPPAPALPPLPQYQWISSAPAGLSITEMEIRQFQDLHPDSAQNRMFFYFRTPQLARSVPVSWRGDFAAESKDAESKMADLKSRILQSGAKVTEDYPWGGGFTFFCASEQEVDETEVTEQEMFQDAQSRQCYGRDKLIAAAMKTVQDAQRRQGGARGIVLVEGGPGEGKTVFMAALANALRSPDKSQKASGCDVISYFTAASQSAQSVEQLLRCLIQWLRKRLGKGEETCLPTSYKNLLAEFHTELKALSEARKSQPLALLVDGVELIQDARGQLRFDWIPQDLPLGVSLVLSVTPNSTLRHTLAKMKGSSVFSLGPLSMLDRREIVQTELAMYGKKLSDSAFNNQLQSLMMKKGSASPLYLHMACEELRSFAVFEKMKDSLQSLPQAVGPLVKQALLRMQSQVRGLGWALAALTVSHCGLRERDLYAILSMCSELSSGSGTVTWQEMLKLARKPQERIPMATFSQFFRTLQSLIGQPYSQGPEDSLTLTNPEVRSAFEQLFLSGAGDKARAHSLLAAHLWTLSDPQGKDTFVHCEADAVIHLPAHLMSSGQMAAMSFLLSSFHFLYANVRHGLLHHLLETYSQFESQNSTAADSAPPGNLEECRSFLKRHAPLFSRWPALFLQQALNEPDGSAPHSWAQGIVGNGRRSGAGGVRLMRWLNKPEQLCVADSELLSSYLSKPTCVALSPGHTLAAVGTENGSLHLIHRETGQEVRSLVSSCDGISGCCFLEEGLLASTSFDGRLEVWDVENGCRTAHVDAHTNRITGCDVSGDRKRLATVSLDFNLKVWSPNGTLVTTLLNPCPLNCVTFDPEGQVLAVGGWDGGVRLWNWLRGEALGTLSGHQQSVRSLSFSPSTSLLSSGSLSGEVRLWAVPALSCVGCYRAHQGSTEVLNFVERGELLLSAGEDGVVQVWSGGLGEEMAVLKEDKDQPDSCHLATTEPPALCVEVSGCHAAVGYHGDGVKLYSADSGERLWSSENLRQSVHCLIWIQDPAAKGAGEDMEAESAKEAGSGNEAGSEVGEDTDTETGSGEEAESETGPEAEPETEAEFLVTGSGDSLLRVWRRRGEDQMELQGSFGVQQGPILALAQSSSHLASASEDFTIALWLVQDLTSDPWCDPSPVSVLRGHSGGVTCLSFSPKGEELLSGGKDRALLLWQLEPPSLSQSLLHCHRDWLTGCAWTPVGSTVVSCSSDGRVCVWELQTGSCIREIPTPLSLTSLSCTGQHVIGGSREGELLLWEWQSGVEISRIAAHRAPIQHCSTLPNTDEENLVVATASDDGTVKLWRPYHVHHHSTVSGHSGGIQGLATRREGVPAFLTVSEDCSLRSCSVSMAIEPPRWGAPAALALSSCGELLMCGFTSGRVQVWNRDSVLCSKKVSDSEVTALACMPDNQFAVACADCSVSVWRLDWNPQHPTAQLRKVSRYTLKCPVKFLCFCTILLGVCENGLILNVTKPGNKSSDKIRCWTHEVRVLGLKPNDDISTWLLGEKDGKIQLSFAFSMGSSTSLRTSFGNSELSAEENGSPSGTHNKNVISAITMDRDFVVCGDNKGNIWFNQPPNPCSWSDKRLAHSERVTVLRLTESTIISASNDRTVKLWDRQSKRQVGVFVCGGPVVTLEVNPLHPTQLVCGDRLGGLYFLSWMSCWLAPLPLAFTDGTR
ncbi:telomerase protein component 1 [Anguilla rostrata]|uniref:telomerase protein component 1 n=1 Tax=Anguilla rostrata TaxID=7938 RepID=UPI0030D3A424